MGIPNNIIIAVKILTKEKGEPYTKYIKRIKENKLACNKDCWFTTQYEFITYP